MYSGDQSKPYPRILLYIPGSLEPLTDSIYTHKLEITKNAFENIRQSIEERKFMDSDSVLLSSFVYQFMISNNGETTIFLTPYLHRIRQIFYTISDQLKSTNDEMRMKRQLESIMKRLVYDNKLN